MIKNRIVALVLSSVLVVTSFFGNTNMGMATQVFAAEAVNAPTNLSLEEKGKSFQITWDSYNGATRYDVYRSKSRYGNYSKVTTVEGLTWTDTQPNSVKYENYYKVAVEGSGNLSNPISLEMEMFGNGMYVFSPNDDINQVYNAVNDVFKIQGAVNENGYTTDGGQFSTGRYALAFKPGDYTNIPADMFNMSYYMQLLGLGELPTQVRIKNVHVPPVLANNNVTCNFWMGIENLSISANDNGSNDPWFAFNWSVSQAAPARRLYVQRTMNLNYLYEGWASGGYVADSIINAAIGSWSQQQYYLRNNNINGDFYGVNWNLVVQGCNGIYGDNWNNKISTYPMYDLESGLGQTNWKSGGQYTILDKTDAVREKPFLYYDTDVNEYKVFAPSMRRNAKGVSWSESGNGQGTTYDISDFYIARADRDSAASINAALDAGKNIIFSPGIYKAEEPINIKRANTIVLGLGLATIIPYNNETGIKIADVDGVTLAGVIIDADSYSKNMLVVGPSGSNRDHSANPTIIQDVFVRVGGVHGGVASTEDALVINSNDVIGDHFWIWRADHGAGVGWYSNTANNGVVVNGDDVTLYGLMVEHFQKYDVLWIGENGRTYFLQNEKAYDPQKQEEWMSHNGTVKGYASYKVANSVDNHYAVGLGMYDVFINTNGASIFLDSAMEVPNKPGVMIENACIVEIANGSGPIVGINSIINGTCPGITTGTNSGGGYARQACLLYNNGLSLSIPDFYLAGNNNNFNNTVNEEYGVEPTYDPVADDYVEEELPNEDSEEPTTEKEEVTSKVEETTNDDEDELTGKDSEETTSEINEEVTTSISEESTSQTLEEPTSKEEESTNKVEETTTENITVEKTNVVLRKNTTASTELGGNACANAVDGNASSRWETIHNAENPQWIQVDLDGTYYIDSFKIAWETAAAMTYEFQVSMDGNEWDTVCNVIDGQSGQTREESFEEVAAKYVRILCTSKTTAYGYSIWEMEVYGSTVSSKPVTTIEGGIEINGYQISSTVGGMRTVYSVDSQIDGKEVVSSGIVYSLADYAPETELFVGSTSNYVRSYESTTAGMYSDKQTDSDIATSYAMTMKFAGGSAKEFNTTYRIRAYAKLSDGTYVYTDAYEYTVYEIADVLYQNCDMSTYTAHNYLYTDILTVVNKDYIEVVYNKSKELVF